MFQTYVMPDHGYSQPYTAMRRDMSMTVYNVRTTMCSRHMIHLTTGNVNLYAADETCCQRSDWKYT